MTGQPRALQRRPERRSNAVPWRLRALAPLAVPAVAALLAVWVPFPARAQVQIVRELPQTGENQAQPDWRAPLPSLQIPAPQRGAQFGGSIGLGATGGMNEAGTPSLDAFVQSTLSLLLPMGGSSGFTLSADANRNPRLDGLDQAYKGDAKLSFDTWQGEVSGG
jgi:hypothetical protein